MSRTHLSTSAATGRGRRGRRWRWPLRGPAAELDDRTAPMAGLVATFVFAAQMLNFPVVGGTSGHLLGGALAAVLVGPWRRALVLAVVLLVQACSSPTAASPRSAPTSPCSGLVGVGVGWLVFRGLQAVLPKRLGLVPASPRSPATSRFP